MTWETDQKTLAVEAFCVGIGNIMMYNIVKRMFPNNINLQLFASGVLFHLTAEYSGLNEYYVNYKTNKSYSEIIIDTTRTKRCMETQSSTEEAFPLCSVLDYSPTGM